MTVAVSLRVVKSNFKLWTRPPGSTWLFSQKLLAEVPSCGQRHSLYLGKSRTVLIKWKIRHGKSVVNHFKTYGRFEVKGKYCMARKTIECANMWFCNSNSTFSVDNFSQVLFGGLICGGRRGLIQDISEHQEQRTKKSLIFFIKTLFTSNIFTKAYSESCQISKMETLCENV